MASTPYLCERFRGEAWYWNTRIHCQLLNFSSSHFLSCLAWLPKIRCSTRRGSGFLIRMSPGMVSDRLIPPSSNLKIYLLHPLILPPIRDDDNLSLLADRESFILKLNRFICFIMLRGWWVTSLVRLNILYGAWKNEDRHKPQTSHTLATH